MTSSDPIVAAFARRVDRGPDDELFLTRERRWRIGDVDRAAALLATRLGEHGFEAGDLLGLAAAPGPAIAVGYLACRRLGIVPVMCDSARPTADRLAALDHLGVAGFLAEATGWPDSAGGWDLDRRSPRERTPGDPRWGAVKLTSGSTGEPRGIAVDGSALLADDRQLRATMGIDERDRLVAAVPLSHSYGFSSVLLPALTSGIAVLVPADRSPVAALTVAREHGGTVLPTVPAWLGAYVRWATAPELPASVRLVLSAGAPLPPAVAVAFRQRTGRPVQVFYGASECGGIAFDRDGRAAERGTVGTPVEGVELAIDGASGRLEVRSPAVAAAYLPHATSDLGAGRFLTSDLAVFDEGEVRLLGRSDDWVLVRGHNVNPREVESVLRDLRGVADVAVFGIDGPDGPRSVLRAIVAAPDGAVGHDQLLTHCRARLAEHKVPRSFVVVDDLPRTARGKLDRAALLSLASR